MHIKCLVMQSANPHRNLHFCLACHHIPLKFSGGFLQTHTFLLLSLLDFLQLQQDKPKRIHIQLQVIAFFFFFSLIYSSSFYPAAQKFISSAGMHRTVGHLTSLHNACAPLCGTTTHISVICRNVCLLGPDCQTRFRSCVDAFG